MTFGLDITLFNTALPAAAEVLRATPGQVQWFVGSYTLAISATLPVAGIVGDRGRARRALLAACSAFVLVNSAFVLVTDATAFIVLRLAQGVASAFILTLSTALIARTFSGPRRTRALYIAALMPTVGIPLGPLLGALVAETMGALSVFLVNVPFVIAAMAGKSAGVTARIRGAGWAASGVVSVMRR
ncbi:MAG: MFS transporter [Micrococcus sp.]|nr:MFS transporter [Micrococcus sp.]